MAAGPLHVYYSHMAHSAYRKLYAGSGYKTDIWLVKTVAILLVAISVGLLAAIPSKQLNIPIAILALIVAVGMAYVDFYYAVTETISKIYMADGFVEILFAISWFVILIKQKITQRCKAI